MAQFFGQIILYENFSYIHLQLFVKSNKTSNEDADSEDGTAEILDDIQEALNVARLQGKIAPVRIARILAGEGTEQFSTNLPGGGANSGKQQTVPLSVALEYVGAVLDESKKEITRLKVHSCGSFIIDVFA